MLAPLFRNVTHLTPMRCASATKRSTVDLSCFVVGTQCMPRPLSPLGCGYAPSGNAPANVLGSIGRGGSGVSTGAGGVVGLPRSTVVGGRLSDEDGVVVDVVRVGSVVGFSRGS